MPSLIHHYEALNLLGLRVDEGRLELISVIGHGAEGDVLLARNVASPGLDSMYTDELYAVKIVSKLGIDGRALVHLQDEVTLHHRACSERHPGIISLVNVVELPNTLFLVSAFAPSGDLFERILDPERPRLCTRPDLVRSIILQLIDVVDYLHAEKGIAHRDIKPENLFWIESGADADFDTNMQPVDSKTCPDVSLGRLLVGDFGLATEDRFAADFGSGTSFYTSPEAAGYFRKLASFSGSGMSPGGALLSPIHLMNDGKSLLPIPSLNDVGSPFIWENRLSYDTFSSDVWSIGIVLINLVCERNPWQYATSSDETFAAYVEDPENTLIAILPTLSDECHELLKRALKVNPRERLTLQEMRAGVLKIVAFTRPEPGEVEYGASEHGELRDAPMSWEDATHGQRCITPGSVYSSHSPSLAPSSASGWWRSDSDLAGTGTTGSTDGKPVHGSPGSPHSSVVSSSKPEYNAGGTGVTAIVQSTTTRPKRPQPLPLQIQAAYGAGISPPGIGSACLARYARPPSSAQLSFTRVPATAPAIRFTGPNATTSPAHGNFVATASAVSAGLVVSKHKDETIKLKMPTPPSAGGLNHPSMLAPTRKLPPLVNTDASSSTDLSALVASVPCALSLSESTNASSDDGLVTPSNEGPATGFLDRGVGGQFGTLIKVAAEHALAINEGSHATNEVLVSAKAPLTPLLLTPTSGHGARRYHPYGMVPVGVPSTPSAQTGGHGCPSASLNVINSPLRMAQQAFLDRHYGQQMQMQQQQQYHGAYMASLAQCSPRRGSVPALMMSEASRMGSVLGKGGYGNGRLEMDHLPPLPQRRRPE